MMKNPSAYLKVWFAIVLGGILATGILNVVVDPNGYFDVVDLPRINIEKPEKSYGRVIKSIEICRDAYDTIIFGTSRIYTGIDPHSRWFDGGAVYNLGLRGTNLYEIHKVAKYVQGCQTPRRILLGIDFLAFSTRRTTRRDFAKSGFAGGLTPNTYLRQIISGQAVIDSVKTVWSNLRDGGDGLKGNGFDEHTGTLEINHRRAFRKTLKIFLTNEKLYADYEYGRDRVDMLREIAQAYADTGARVYVFIPPVHAQQLEALSQVGLYETFEQWKRDVVRVVASLNQRVPGKVGLWDFTGYNSISTETVPAARARRRMRWFYESSHFTPETGDLVLLSMLHPEASGEIVPDDFGVSLNEKNLETHIAEARRARESYRLSRPEEVEEVARLVEATAAKRDRLRGKSRKSGDNPGN